MTTSATVPDASELREPAEPGPGVGLRPRELLFLLLHSRGYTRAQLGDYFADVLGMTAQEVDGTLDSAARHLGAADLDQAVSNARRRGLIE